MGQVRLGRPRTASAAVILAAVGIAVGANGPARLTLADVARVAGVTAGAVAQRFGSKRNRLLSFVRSAQSAQRFVAAHAASPAQDPLDRLLDALIAISFAAPSVETPEAFANHLAFLHLDIADPDLRAALADQERALEEEIRAQLAAARTTGQLQPSADVQALAGALIAMRHGAQIRWAIHRSGALAAALMNDLHTLLAPYRAVAAGVTAPHPPHGGQRRA